MSVRYVALGDSYTIGTSVEPDESFPEQLAAALRAEGIDIGLVANLGINGYTSADLIREELPALDELSPDFMTLLVGVNDAVQGVPLSTYERNVAAILDDLLTRVPASRIVAVTVPDYTHMPRGADYGDPVDRSVAITANNTAMTRIAAAHGIAVVDIVDISLEVATDPSLAATDGLHPSGTQYARWVGRIAPVAERLIAR